MKKRKGLLTILLAVVMAALLLACSKSENGQNDVPAPETNTATPEPTQVPTPVVTEAPAVVTPEPSPTPTPSPTPVTPETVWGDLVSKSEFDDDLYSINDIGIGEYDYCSYYVVGDRIIALTEHYEDSSSVLHCIDPADFSSREVKLDTESYSTGIVKLGSDSFAVYDYEYNYSIYDLELNLIDSFGIFDSSQYGPAISDRDGLALYYIDEDYVVSRFDIATHETTKLPIYDAYNCYIVSVTGDGRILINWYGEMDDGELDVYDMATGEIVKTYDVSWTLNFNDDYSRYFATSYNDDVQGIYDAETDEQLLYVEFEQPQEFWNATPFWDRNIIATVESSWTEGSDTYIFRTYSMETGELIAKTAFRTGSSYSSNGLFDPDRGFEFFLRFDNRDKIGGFVWDFEHDDEDMINIYTKFTHLPGELYDKARAIEERYNVYVYIGHEASVNKISDYTAEICMDPYKIDKALDIVSEVFSMYPDDFFDQLKVGDVHTLGIYITGTLNSNGGNTVSNALALTNTCSYEDSMLVDANYVDSVVDGLAETMIHEISHWVDTKIDTAEMKGLVEEYYENWISYCPDDFSYGFSYSNQKPKHKYILSWADSDDMVYYYDEYSQTYPTEDRARLFEHIMVDDIKENNWHSPHLRAKLHYFFDTIRQAFDTTEWPEETLWEQKLREADEYADYILEHPEERFPPYEGDEEGLG